MRRISSRFTTPVAWIAIIALGFLLLAPGDAHARITATQSVRFEYDAGQGSFDALGTLVVDLALGERMNLTYIHDRGVDPQGLWQQHDVSVTRVLWRDTTATMGVRLKIPGEEPKQFYYYTLVAWMWGGP